MNKMILSNHAIERCNQRGIPEAMVDLVIRFGAVEYHSGSEILRLDKKGMRKAKEYLGNLYSGSKNALSEIYLVVNGEKIITAARKTKHHKRQR